MDEYMPTTMAPLEGSNGANRFLVSMFVKCIIYIFFLVTKSLFTK